MQGTAVARPGMMGVHPVLLITPVVYLRRTGE